MSGELEITGGGVISVDPAEMRAVADRMAALPGCLSHVAELVRRAHAVLSGSSAVIGWVDLHGLWALSGALDQHAEELRSDAHGTAVMADAFEVADLRARQEMLAIKRPIAADALQRRIDALLEANSDLDAMAAQMIAAWQKNPAQGLFGQWGDVILTNPLGMQRIAAMQAMAVLQALIPVARERGALIDGASRGRGAPAVVAPVSRTTVAAAPRSISQMADRIPGGEAQVAVEKRTHLDGSESFEVYIDGTRSFLSGGEEPWDMGSNWDLYIDHEKSASYTAVVKALEQAGAEPGQLVNVVGFSQGGAIAAMLATSGVYETRRVTLIGSPLVPLLGSDQTLIHLRHTDDPVGTGLTAGGPAGTTGAPDSVTVTREHASGWDPTSAVAHPMSAYEETITMAEESGDGRIDVIGETLSAEADDILSVERTEYHATRP